MTSPKAPNYRSLRLLIRNPWNEMRRKSELFCGHLLVINWSSTGHRLVIGWSSTGHRLVIDANRWVCPHFNVFLVESFSTANTLNAVHIPCILNGLSATYTYTYTYYDHFTILFYCVLKIFHLNFLPVIGSTL